MSTWVFLRGLTRESRHWGNFPAFFRDEIGNADIIALDLPGNGQLYRMRSPASVAAMARHCRDELQARGMRPPFHVLAMSLGAMMAVAWADLHADELAGCVLINTSLRPFNPIHQRLRPGSYGTLLKLLLPGGSPETRERRILRLTSRLASDPERIVAAWSAWQSQYPVAPANALRQLWAAGRYRAPRRRPAVPLLILASAADALVDPRCSRQLAQHWQADFAEHPAAGHDIPLDDGAWVARQVRDWLQGAEPSAVDFARS